VPCGGFHLLSRRPTTTDLAGDGPGDRERLNVRPRASTRGPQEESRTDLASSGDSGEYAGTYIVLRD